MAVRDNENAAAAYTVRPAWEKIRAFAIAGALAGLGGALLSGAFANVAFAGPGSFFLVDGSLSSGGHGGHRWDGLGHRCGHRAVWVIGIPALAPNNQVLGLLTSSIGLLADPALLPPWAQPDRLRRPGRVLGLGGSSLWQGRRPAHGTTAAG